MDWSRDIRCQSPSWPDIPFPSEVMAEPPVGRALDIAGAPWCGDGILLGGTYQRGVETLEPDPVETERILADHAAFFGAMGGKGRSFADPARRAREWRVVRGR